MVTESLILVIRYMTIRLQSAGNQSDNSHVISSQTIPDKCQIQFNHLAQLCSQMTHSKNDWLWLSNTWTMEHKIFGLLSVKAHLTALKCYDRGSNPLQTWIRQTNDKVIYFWIDLKLSSNSTYYDFTWWITKYIGKQRLFRLE